MFAVIFQGLLLGLSFVAPIGMQNLYVINAALKQPKLKAYQIAMIVIIFDIMFSFACFYGMGILIDKFPFFKQVLVIVGGTVIIYIGYKLVKASPEIKSEVNVDLPIVEIMLACFLVTWANPQAIIDGSILLGGSKASLMPSEAKFFITGVCMASTIWFLTLTTIVSFTKDKFNENVIKSLNVFCGGVIIVYGIKLLWYH